MTEREYQLQIGTHIENAAVSLKGDHAESAIALLEQAVALAEIHPDCARNAPLQLDKIVALLYAAKCHSGCGVDTAGRAAALEHRASAFARSYAPD